MFNECKVILKFNRLQKQISLIFLINIIILGEQTRQTAEFVHHIIFVRTVQINDQAHFWQLLERHLGRKSAIQVNAL